MIEEGTKVKVYLPNGKDVLPCLMKFDRNEYVELKGATSEHGIPYAFLCEWLVEG